MFYRIQRWFAGNTKAPYEAVSSGFHPFEENEGKYLPHRHAVEPLVAPQMKVPMTRRHRLVDSDTLGWSTIQDSCPELTFDAAFDERRLGTPHM